MRIFSHTIFIARSPQDVFDTFVDFSLAPRWRSFVTSMELIDPAPIRAGSRVRVRMELMGGEHEYILTVLTYERPSLWRHKTDETYFKGAIEYRFDAEGTGTRVTFSGRVKPIALYGWLALPLMWLRRGQTYRDQLPQLKRVMEDG